MILFVPMIRRSTPRSKVDDIAFPIRVKIVVPPYGLSTLLDEMHQWLKASCLPNEYASHPAQTRGGSATAYYFRDIETARAFLARFPALALADCTDDSTKAR